MSGIGTLNEKPLHEALKQWYAQAGDRFEAPVDGFVVDIVRGDLLIEIQTRNLAAIRRKLHKLVARHPVRLVYPIAGEKWIVKDAGGAAASPSRRRSPKRGGFVDVFEGLVSIPALLTHPNFSIELLLIQEEEVRRWDGARGWRRRGWITIERRLLNVLERRTLASAADAGAFFPPALEAAFTSGDLASALGVSRRLAQKMVYCWRLMGSVSAVGKRSRAVLYARNTGSEPEGATGRSGRRRRPQVSSPGPRG